MAANGINLQDKDEKVLFDAACADIVAYGELLQKPHIMGDALMKLINKAQGVLSLSRAKESLLMWSHYADSHKGFVIGLDESNTFFRARDGKGRPTKPHNVIYTSRRTVINAGSEDFYERLLCYKSLEWAYEEEVRVFRTFGKSEADFESNTREDVHLFALPRDCIKEIYIGANASITTRERIRNIIDRRKLQVRLFETSVAHDRFALEFREVTKALHSYRPEERLSRSDERPTGYSIYDFEFNGIPNFYIHSRPF